MSNWPPPPNILKLVMGSRLGWTLTNEKPTGTSTFGTSCAEAHTPTNRPAESAAYFIIMAPPITFEKVRSAEANLPRTGQAIERQTSRSRLIGTYKCSLNHVVDAWFLNTSKTCRERPIFCQEGYCEIR